MSMAVVWPSAQITSLVQKHACQCNIARELIPLSYTLLISNSFIAFINLFDFCSRMTCFFADLSIYLN